MPGVKSDGTPVTMGQIGTVTIDEYRKGMDVDEINRQLKAACEGMMHLNVAMTETQKRIIEHMSNRALLIADFSLQRSLWRRGWRPTQL